MRLKSANVGANAASLICDECKTALVAASYGGIVRFAEREGWIRSPFWIERDGHREIADFCSSECQSKFLSHYEGPRTAVNGRKS